MNQSRQYPWIGFAQANLAKHARRVELTPDTVWLRLELEPLCAVADWVAEATARRESQPRRQVFMLGRWVPW